MAVLEKLKKKKKKKKTRKKKKKIFIHHNNRYYIHLFPGMIQDPSRAVLAPCRPLPLRGKWSVRTQGGLGWWGVCAVPWMDLIVSISQHYVYIYKCEFIYPHHWDTLMPATVLLSHAGTGPHYLGGKWSVRTPGVGGRSGGDLRHGTGHQPAPHHPLTHLNTAFQS